MWVDIRIGWHDKGPGPGQFRISEYVNFDKDQQLKIQSEGTGSETELEEYTYIIRAIMDSGEEIEFFRGTFDECEDRVERMWQMQYFPPRSITDALNMGWSIKDGQN